MAKEPIPTFQCEYCGKNKERRRFRYKDGRLGGYDFGSRFCSRECGWMGRKRRPISSAGYLVPSGYRRLHKRGGQKVYEHREVMEEILGRKLRANENVHHKDGNRSNNHPENLELWVKGQPPGQRLTDKVAFAIEILRLYPEFARQAGVGLVDLHE